MKPHRFQVVHETVYRYSSPVSTSYGQARLLPRAFDGQRCLSSSLLLDPAPEDMRERVDFFGNRVAYFVVSQRHKVLRVTASSDVEIAATGSFPPPVDHRTLTEIRTEIAALSGPERVTAVDFLLDSPRAAIDDAVRRYAEASFSPETIVLDGVRDLMGRIHADFAFDRTASTVTSTIADLFAARAGVCQDFAHLTVACLRAVGLPARYVSGYLETDPPPGGTKLVGADVSHAWASIMLPDHGWVDLDPTNNQFTNERYVTIGWGRDYGDVPPITGVIFSNGGATKLQVAVDVRRME